MFFFLIYSYKKKDVAKCSATIVSVNFLLYLPHKTSSILHSSKNYILISGVLSEIRVGRDLQDHLAHCSSETWLPSPAFSHAAIQPCFNSGSVGEHMPFPNWGSHSITGLPLWQPESSFSTNGTLPSCPLLVSVLTLCIVSHISSLHIFQISC